MRVLLRDFLEHGGHRVIERSGGWDVVALVESERVDVVILDKEMPGVSGLDLLLSLRHRYPTVPVIFITAFGGQAVAAEAVRRGAHAYLEKPFRISAVLETIAQVTRHAADRSLPS